MLSSDAIVDELFSIFSSTLIFVKSFWLSTVAFFTQFIIDEWLLSSFFALFILCSVDVLPTLVKDESSLF